jgi:hypothetical protein
MWVQHERVPPPYGREVRQGLSENYPGRWIDLEREAPVFWPVRSPDLNPFYSFLWGYLEVEI